MPPQPELPELRTTLAEALADAATFLRLTIVGPAGDAGRWQKVVFRPVEIRGERLLQEVANDGRKDITRNHPLDAIPDRLGELIGGGFRTLQLQTSERDLHARLTKKGRLMVHGTKPSRPGAAPELRHDRQKRHAVGGETADPVLVALGIQTDAGKVRERMQGKFRQINDFLNLLRPVIERLDPPISVLDCGCGKAYLTFTLLGELRKMHPGQVEVVGIDVNPEVIDHCRKVAQDLGWPEARFGCMGIEDYRPMTSPDVVLSLHACDTATDDALAQGVRLGARAILAAPCCQHELNSRIEHAAFQPVLKHGILRERTADILTDAFRAQLLTLHGYHTEVVEFVDRESTARNLLIRAVRTGQSPPAEARENYEQLKALWGVTPYLETALAAGMAGTSGRAGR